MDNWKLLIADDEVIIREGIREAIDWDVLNMTIVAEAEDGEEALELSLENKVDVVLADVNMPIMNGLSFIKHLRSELPSCKIVIISGHDEFSYAQEAVRLNVADYIMKPVDPVQLTEVLQGICEELELEGKQKAHLQMASRQIEKNIPHLRERFCIDWLKGEISEGEVWEQLAFLKLPTFFPKQMGVIRWPEIQSNQPLMAESERQLILFSIENIVGELLADYEYVLFRDEIGLHVLILWEVVPDEVLLSIDAAISKYVMIRSIQHFEKVDGSSYCIGEVYRHCKAEVYGRVEVSHIARQAEQFLQENYQEAGISLETVAKELHVSAVYLSRIVKQDLGISFVHLLTKLRVQKAIQLLTCSNKSILEIAEEVGYDSQHYFSTAFKKVMGVSPNQYRKGEAFVGKG
ncbi:response regulator [Evansella sp. AB-rgal1]|uniref:response regulator transcription factor n=1 Tax=Evansella sp. AB-rgal1 TaxID=3242696 RepID=UPI00359E26ED